MTKISTLVYMLDDTNPTPGRSLTPLRYDLPNLHQLSILLDLLALDPGESLVTKTMERIRKSLV